MPLSEFRDLLEAAAKRFPTKHAFARELGITPGRLSRVLGGEHSLDVLNCLKLAKMTGESASHVLRVAGKGEIAELLESLYGRTAPALNPGERDLLDAWGALTQRARDSLKVILRDLAPKEREKPKRKTA